MSSLNENNSGKFFPNLETKIGQILEHVTKFIALLGGLTLVALVVLILVNLIARFIPYLTFRPIRYDFELTQAGASFAFFAFLPWCLLQHGRVAFDSLVRGFGPIAVRVSTLINSILMAIVSSLIFSGMAMLFVIDIGVPMQTIQFYVPMWVSSVAPTFGAFLTCLVAYYCVWRSANEFTGQGSKF